MVAKHKVIPLDALREKCEQWQGVWFSIHLQQLCASELRTAWNRAKREHPLLIIVSFIYTLFSIPTLGHSFLPHAHLKLIICEQVLSMCCKCSVSVCIVYICVMMSVVYVTYM